MRRVFGPAWIVAVIMLLGASTGRADAATFSTPAGVFESKCAFMQWFDAQHGMTFDQSHWTGSQWVGVTCP